VGLCKQDSTPTRTSHVPSRPHACMRHALLRVGAPGASSSHGKVMPWWSGAARKALQLEGPHVSVGFQACNCSLKVHMCRLELEGSCVSEHKALQLEGSHLSVGFGSVKDLLARLQQLHLSPLHLDVPCESRLLEGTGQNTLDQFKGAVRLWV